MIYFTTQRLLNGVITTSFGYTCNKENEERVKQTIINGINRVINHPINVIEELIFENKVEYRIIYGEKVFDPSLVYHQLD